MTQARSITMPQRYGVWWAWNGQCGWCRIPIYFADCHIDHIIPMSAAAMLPDLVEAYSLPSTFEMDGFENWICSCQGCNLRKGNMVLERSPVLLLVLQGARDRAQKAKMTAEAIDSDRALAPALTKVGAAYQAGRVSRSDIEAIVFKVPPPDGDMSVSQEWHVRSIEGKVHVVRLNELYTTVGVQKFRAEQRAIQDEIEKLSRRSQRLDADISRLPPKSDPAALEKLTTEKLDVDARLATLKGSVRNIGYVAP